MTQAIPIDIKITPENKCGFCTNSTCCTYITQEMDTPRSIDDFDALLWQLAHENVQIYKDEDGWYLLINNRCKYLVNDGRCAIYETRPQVCREHSNDDCEFNTAAGFDDFERYYPNYESLLKYCRKRFKNWDKRFKTE